MTTTPVTKYRREAQIRELDKESLKIFTFFKLVKRGGMAAKVGKRRSGSFTCSGTVALFGWVHRLYIEKDYTHFFLFSQS